jgi:hypothetical protein
LLDYICNIAEDHIASYANFKKS